MVDAVVYTAVDDFKDVVDAGLDAVVVTEFNIIADVVDVDFNAVVDAVVVAAADISSVVNVDAGVDVIWWCRCRP